MALELGVADPEVYIGGLRFAAGSLAALLPSTLLVTAADHVRYQLDRSAHAHDLLVTLDDALLNVLVTAANGRMKAAQIQTSSCAFSGRLLSGALSSSGAALRRL